MFKITCKEMTGSECDFTCEGATAEEAKKTFYAHGAESPMHKEAHDNATPEQMEAFGKKLDEYLAKQGQ
jgi:hypothetical protein